MSAVDPFADMDEWQPGLSKDKPAQPKVQPIKANGSDTQTAPTERESIWPQSLDLEALSEREPEKPRFIIPDWGPVGYAWLFAGHGGVGKSGIALHLAVCMAAGVPFFGIAVERKRVLYLSCEDRESVLHWRLTRICAYLNINLATLRGWLEVVDLVSSESVLWERDQKDGTTLRVPYFELQHRMRDHDTEVLFVDGITDTYAGNENSKPEVKRYVRSLVKLIDPNRGAVLLIGHIAKPGASGIPLTEGYSGTTAWHNSVRSRWYLYPETAKDDDGQSDKTGELILELQKSNFGPVDRSLRFAWDEEAHLFVGTDPGASSFDRKHQDREERAGIMLALRACVAASVVVPAATQGQRTAYHVLKARQEFPEGLQGKANAHRFWRHIEALRHGQDIREDTHVRGDRKKVQHLLPR